MPVAGFGPKDAVTPPGKAEVMARFTLPVNPFCAVIAMFSATFAPCASASEVCAGVSVNEETGVAVTDRLNWLMVSARDPSAWMPINPAPGDALLLAVNVSALVWPKLIDVGLKDAVTPGASSGAESLMVSAYWPTGIAETASVTEAPRAIVEGYGETFR